MLIKRTIFLSLMMQSVLPVSKHLQLSLARSVCLLAYDVESRSNDTLPCPDVGCLWFASRLEYIVGSHYS